MGWMWLGSRQTDRPPAPKRMVREVPAWSRDNGFWICYLPTFLTRILLDERIVEAEKIPQVFRSYSGLMRALSSDTRHLGMNSLAYRGFCLFNVKG